MTQTEFLQDLIDYYSKDTLRRAVNSDNSCKYRDGKGRQCAIGRWIPDDKYNSDMDSTNATFDDIVSVLPKEVAALGYDFLQECQMLHDENYHWTEPSGISQDGKYYISVLENKYDIKVNY